MPPFYQRAVAAAARHDEVVSEQSVVVAPHVTLTCRMTGDPAAPPIVLLQALGESGAAWDAVVPAFACHYRVIVPELRGHGDSTWPGTYSLTLMRDDVLALLDALGLDRVVLVGHSLGAAVAWLLAISEPQRVNRLVVEDAPPPFARETPVRERPDGPLPFDWAAIVAIAAEVNDPTHRWWRHLPMLDVPTLVIGGGPTSSIPQEVLARAAALVPDCTLVTIPAGHHVHESQPQAFSDAVFDWLRRT